LVVVDTGEAERETFKVGFDAVTFTGQLADLD
jgi:hypothetical protein